MVRASKDWAPILRLSELSMQQPAEKLKTKYADIANNLFRTNRAVKPGILLMSNCVQSSTHYDLSACAYAKT
jgi:hypothetical protein